MDDLTEGELLKVDLTPTMVGGTASGEHEENGFKLNWTATDTGITEHCTFSFPFPDKTGIPYGLWGEIWTNFGHHWRFDYNEGVEGNCFWMVGGTFRLVR